MGFLFPLFLLAGLSIAIPIIIHLVNLRQYKHELFPNVRFLRQLKIISKRSAKINKKWLLLSRILFLLALVTAFAHPYLKGKDDPQTLQTVANIIYIDNSLSMSAQKNGQSLLSLAKNQALQLVGSGATDSRYILLSNDQLFLTDPLDKKEAIQKINSLNFTSKIVSLSDIKDLLLTQDQDLVRHNTQRIYLFSDFQKSTLIGDKNLTDSLIGSKIYLFPIQETKTKNRFIDTGWVEMPEELAGQKMNLVLKIGRQDSSESGIANLRVLINGQTRQVKTINFETHKSYKTDTLPLVLDPEGWNKIEAILEDGPVTFDDTFRLVTQKPAGYSVLVMAPDGKISPYLQAAFNSMPGVKWDIIPSTSLNQKSLSDYSLIVVQNGEDPNPVIFGQLKTALNSGINLLIFPGNNNNPVNLNANLKSFEDIHLGNADTTNSQVMVLEKNHPLVKDLFESIPGNIQLPTANRHYPLSSGLSANQQDIMDFADGTPLLAGFNFTSGKLYLCTSSLEGQSSNFPLSYFFAPLLYKMTVPSGGVFQFYSIIGSGSPVLIPNKNQNTDRQVWHLHQKGLDLVPAQSITQQGLGIFVGKSVDHPGFYWLQQEGETKDSIWLAVNNNPLESHLAPAEKSEIQKVFPGNQPIWLDAEKVKSEGWQPTNAFPIWKIAVILALLCLIFETLILTGAITLKEGQKKNPVKD